jgi:pilus assembly protein FimV
MRGLTKTLVAVTLLTSTSVYSLGIGSIKLHSALNQKLNAEIALVASAGESIGDIHVKLASPAKFDEAGVPWSYFLTKIKFTPVVKADGSIVVRLTSDETLKEPFLDFLVEVSGPSGSLYREFTVLVDPPTTYKQPTRFTEPKAAVRTVSSQPVRQIDASSQAYHGTTELNGTRTDDSGGHYGPVRKSDTIWSIANQVKTDDVSAAQMVMAIYAANPSAFSKANVNALSTGEMLSIPDRDAVLQLTPHQALTEFKQQGYSWRHGGTKRSSTGRKTATPVSRHKQKHPPLDARSAYGNVKVAEPEALRSAPAPEGNSADKHELADALNNKALDEQSRAIADATPATLEAESEEDIALKQRFERIEQQLQMMQKMLEQKDAQLLSLQAKQPAVNADATPPVSETPTAPVITEVQAVNPPASVPVSGNTPLALVEPEPESMPIPATVVQAVPVQAAATLQTTPGDPFADYYLPGGAIAVGLLSLLGLVWWRRRQSEQELDTESMFASASQISLPDDDQDAVAASRPSSGYEVGMVGESAFLSEFTPSELDAFETDQVEIDPMSEADVYLAYGRYQQAEELIRQVIDEHPERNECKLKLLEIYQASENRLEFNQYIRQLISEGKQADSAFWAKVVEMADEFTPGSGALISGVETNESAPDMQVDAGDSLARADDFKPLADHFDFDLSTLLDKDESASDTAVEPEAVSMTLEQDSDFSPGIDFSGRRFGAERDASSLDDSERVEKDAEQQLDFDLNLFAAEPFSSFSAQEEELKFITEEDEGNTLNSDFDLSAFAAENLTADDDALAFMNENATNRLDFDVNAFSLENNAVADENVRFNEDDKDEAFDFNLSAFDEEFELAAQETVDRGSDADVQDDLSLSKEAIVFEKNSPTAEIAGFAADGSGDEFDVDFNLSAFAEEFERIAADVSEGTGEDEESTLSSQVSAAPILTLVQNDTQDEAVRLSFEDVNEATTDDRFNFDFSLDDDIYAKEAANKEEGGFSFNDGSDELPDFNFDFDFNLPTGDASKKLEKRFDHVEVGGLTASDNSVETKINLAHAYVDMGDMAAAKVIADDLLTGTAEQKKSGQAILEKIN